MKYLTSILQRLRGFAIIQDILPKDIPKPMGRWTNEYCYVKTNQKVDLSNEDHCGPCGQYALLKREEKNTK
jgi:hypothetical protein